ncbi:recombinase family protein [Tsuneonella sp. YG55]|uniref:Recombinase family protein n=1 Tax=Tsuneonella litorea TaxID=2976475 RepID=A0A9X2VYB2_9SPHN|nr:recombinase family protein [Tsuneonella litorea]MCT2557361.1 recombinase family protein [Tsuneonella litorea]
MAESLTFEQRRSVRCAVYTRKSTEEGLEQEFNSLDAQYDACASYIASQRHEGWTHVRDRYDDGGFSGGTLERPALQRLLADVSAGKIDVIVLYKIDRLTRSLSDFSRIVDVLEKAGASFVSVTQSFNTTTSMGRLMLNVLLSFAQFEREVTGERIRDKIAAAKKKGLWMGGPVPPGYEVKDRKLVIDEEEAATVRHIFERYAELGSGRLLLEDLRASGIRTKRRVYKDGSVRGGVAFTRGALFHLLGNRIYLGEMVHKGKAWPGEHEAIVDAGLWDRVSHLIKEGRVDRKSRRNASEACLLAGIVFDGRGRKMSPSHTDKKGKRYRYYITHSSEDLSQAPAWRLPAHDIEKSVIGRLVQFLEDRSSIRRLVGLDDAARLSAALDLCQHTADRLRYCTYHRRTKIPTLIERVDVRDADIQVQLSSSGLGKLLRSEVSDERRLTLTAPVCRIRKGKEVRLVITDEPQAERDEAIVSLLREALTVRDEVFAEPGQTISELATATGRCRKRLGQLLHISWLSPDIVDAILGGRHAPSLTAKQLLGTSFPLEWSRQKAALLSN